MGILDKANYYSEANKKQGWHVEIIGKIIELNPHILTPELASETKASLAPKEALTDLIDNYDEKKASLEGVFDKVIMTKQESYGRSR